MYAKIPKISLGRKDVERAYGADEWVGIEQIVSFSKVYTLMALRACRGRWSSYSM